MIFSLLLAATTLTITLSPSPTPTIKPDSEIQKIRQVVQQKVQEKIREITQNDTDPKKAFLGTITQITDNLIKISTAEQIQEIVIDDTTLFFNQKSIKQKLADFKPGFEILVIGLKDESKFTGKRIILVDLKKLQNQNVIIFGKIVDASTTSPTLMVIPTNDKNVQYQITYDAKKTEFINRKNEKISPDTFKKGQKVSIIALPDPKVTSNFVASKIIISD
jgi:hypothetical protein